jgi:hypothetical protein
MAVPRLMKSAGLISVQILQTIKQSNAQGAFP